MHVQWGESLWWSWIDGRWFIQQASHESYAVTNVACLSSGIPKASSSLLPMVIFVTKSVSSQRHSHHLQWHSIRCWRKLYFQCTSLQNLQLICFLDAASASLKMSGYIWCRHHVFHKEFDADCLMLCWFHKEVDSSYWKVYYEHEKEKNGQEKDCGMMVHYLQCWIAIMRDLCCRVVHLECWGGAIMDR